MRYPRRLKEISNGQILMELQLQDVVWKTLISFSGQSAARIYKYQKDSSSIHPTQLQKELKNFVQNLSKLSWKQNYDPVRIELSNIIERWERINISKLPIMTTAKFHEELKKLESKITDDSLKDIRQKLHDYGFILDFSECHSRVIVSPKWLGDMFRTVISYHQIDSLKEGKISKEMLSKTNWKDYDIKTQELLFSLLEEFGIGIQNPQDKGTVIIPSLLSSTTKELREETKQKWEKVSNKKEIIGRSYSLTFVPYGLFSRLFVHLFKEVSPAICFWKNALIIKHKTDTHALVQNIPEGLGSGTMKISCTGSESDFLLAKLHQVISGFLDLHYKFISKAVLHSVHFKPAEEIEEVSWTSRHFNGGIDNLQTILTNGLIQVPISRFVASSTEERMIFEPKVTHFLD